MLKMLKLFVYIRAYMCHSMYVEVRGQLARAGSLFPPRGSWGLNSGQQAWQSGILSAEPVCQLKWF